MRTIANAAYSTGFKFSTSNFNFHIAALKASTDTRCNITTLRDDITTFNFNRHTATINLSTANTGTACRSLRIQITRAPNN